MPQFEASFLVARGFVNQRPRRADEFDACPSDGKTLRIGEFFRKIPPGCGFADRFKQESKRQPTT